MAEDNPQISVSFLRTYDALKDKKDEQLQKIVDRLANEMITEKSDLDNVKRKTLADMKFPALALDALKPEEGKPL